ncbi:hypothetical protein ACA910_014531 [Epithemia clementina (nom. ined.)]
MGNTESTPGSDRKRSSKRRNKDGHTDVASRAKQVVGESVQNLQANIQTQIKHLEEQDHPAAHFLDTVCGGYMDDREVRRGRSASFYSEDYGSEEEDDDRTYSEDETTTTTDYNSTKRGRGRERRRDEPSVGNETASYLESDYEQQEQRGRGSKKKPGSTSFESEDSLSRAGGISEKSGPVNVGTEEVGKAGASGVLPKPLASSFAKRCYFTKAGIGSSTQHYEGLTLTGNVVLMLAQAMKLKGCPTICDEDLRRVEQTYPNQFSRLPDELLLSSGWRRISKYCHFSNKAIPDGIPFFHSKQRLHPTGGYYFLLAAAVGMVRPIDVEPLTRDTLVLLETDFPSACDAAPKVLIEDPDQWTLVDKFCFFSGGPINTDEDVYYQADFDGNPIYMLAFLSPSLTPAELYKLDTPDGEPGLKSVMHVEEVESVYDLTERDFDDLRLYHLGPCRALPQYILQPAAWTKVLPPHFLQARDTALQRAEEYEMAMQGPSSPVRGQLFNHPMGAHGPQHLMDLGPMDPMMPHHMHPQHMQMQQPMFQHIQGMQQHDSYQQQQLGMMQFSQLQMQHSTLQENMHAHQQHYAQQDDQMLPMDEAAESPPRPIRGSGMDPPDDEPPSLSKRGDSVEESPYHAGQQPNHSLHQNGFIYGDLPDQMAGYPKDNSETSNRTPDEYNQEQHIYSTAEGQQYPGDEDDIQQGDHHYQNMDDQRMHYHEDDIHGQHEEDERYANASQRRTHYQHEDDANRHYHEEKRFSNTSQQRIQFHDEEQETPHYQDEEEQNSQYYQEETEQDGYYKVPQDKTEDSDDYHQPSLQYSEDKHVGYYSESKEEADVAQDDEPASPQEQSLSPLKYEYSADQTEEPGNDQVSPASNANTQSEFSHTSSAMRGARELLKRNRQRRLELAARRSQDHSENANSIKDATSPQSEVSGATWESGSEVTSVVSATSSAWTENSTAPERSSRRALILQMAKARMKNNKSGGTSVAGGETASEFGNQEILGTYSITEEEKKLDGPLEDDQATDIDIAGDLD